MKIRLAEIDTPGKGQPYGNKAKLTVNKLVKVEKVDLDRNGRAVGKVYMGKLM